MKQRTANQTTPRRVWKPVALGVAALLTAVVLTVVIVRFARPLVSGPTLTTLVVQGDLHHVAPVAIRAAVLPMVQGKGFFQIDIRNTEQAIESLPWVAVATVRRSWPHTLYISLAEEVPVARWNSDGLLDAQGKVFVHGDVSGYSSLPQLNGPEGDAGDVLAAYRTFAALVNARGLAISTLTVDERGAANVQLSDGIEVRLGREAAQQRLERFGAVALPALGPQLSSVAYVDMRYTNGFAVGWKTANAGGTSKVGEVRPNV
jgi:cell division protein FtsQ